MSAGEFPNQINAHIHIGIITLTLRTVMLIKQCHIYSYDHTFMIIHAQCTCMIIHAHILCCLLM